MFVYTVGIVLGLELIHPTSSGRMGNDSPPEQLPHPKETVRELQTPVFEMFPYERINRYEVWQYYGVDRQGTWRPRVIYSPWGAYYLYNGQSYPFTPVRPLNFMPYATD